MRFQSLVLALFAAVVALAASATALCPHEAAASGLRSHRVLAAAFGVHSTAEDFNANTGKGEHRYGLDMVTPLDASHMSCLKAHGYDFVIPRGHRSTGVIDNNYIATVQAARAAGLNYTGVYHFPCPTCPMSAAAQVQQLVTSFKQNNAMPDMLWLDVEGTQYWLKNDAKNQQWFTDYFAAAVASGVPFGVYSNHREWTSIFGSLTFTVPGLPSHPLWYARYNYLPTPYDYTAFGGWVKPNMKQYLDNKSLCAVEMDMNVFYQ